PTADSPPAPARGLQAGAAKRRSRRRAEERKAGLRLRHRRSARADAPVHPRGPEGGGARGVAVPLFGWPPCGAQGGSGIPCAEVPALARSGCRDHPLRRGEGGALPPAADRLLEGAAALLLPRPRDRKSV